MECTEKINVFENRQKEHNARVEARLESRLESLSKGKAVHIYYDSKLNVAYHL